MMRMCIAYRQSARAGARLKLAIATLAAAFGLAISSSALALSFVSFDTRSMALGGTGVAYTRYSNAPLFNPAMLSVKREDEANGFSFSLHTGARLIDRDGFLDGVRHYQDSHAEDAFKSALSDFNDSVDRQLLTVEDFDRLSAAADELLDDIEGLSRRPLRAGGSVGVSLARSGRTGVAVFSRVYAVGGGIADFIESDRSLVDGVLDFGRSTLELRSLFGPYVDLLRENSTTLQTSYQLGGFELLEQDVRGLLSASELADNADALIMVLRSYHDAYLAGAVEFEDVGSLTHLPDFDEESQSTLELQGSLITEAGVSFSRRLISEGGLSLGATLKNVKFETFDYLSRIVDATSENISFHDHRTAFSDANVDIGMAASVTARIRWGIVLRNLIPRDYETIRGNVIELRPQVRVGMAWERENLAIAADLDITRNEPLGFDSDKRFIGFGFERRWFRWSIRAGLRHNIVDNSELYSIGTAVRIGRTRLEMSAAGAHDAAAAALQIGIDF